MAKKKKKKYKYSHGGPHNTDLDKVKKGLRYVESSDGLKMINPNSSATGLYGQLYSAEELQNMSYLQGVDRQSFASDTTLQNKLFEDRYYDRIPGVPGLGKNADDLRVEYKKVLEDKGISFNYTDDEISALSNLLGRQGTREYFGYVLRDGRSLADVFPKIYGEDAEAPNKTPEKYLETYRIGRDLKYGGNMKKIKKYKHGGDPPVKQPDYLQYKGPHYFHHGNPSYTLEQYQDAITRDSTALSKAWLPEWDQETIKRLQLNRQLRNVLDPYTDAEIRDLNLLGDQSSGVDNKAYGGRAIPKAGWGDMFKKLGKQIKAGGAGIVEGFTGGILPATKLLPESQRIAYGDEAKMGSRFGTAVGILAGGGAFSGGTAAGTGVGTASTNIGSWAPQGISSSATTGSLIPATAGGAGTMGTAAGFSSVPGANIFNSIYGSGINPSLMNPSLAGAGSGASTFNNLLNMGSSFDNIGSGLFDMFNNEQTYQQQVEGQDVGFTMGGRATNMQKDMGQDINVESGELLMSNTGGKFQSMNPKAPIKEVMPGVSMVQGNQSSDNVPIKIPDGDTMVFSKRLGYADKGLELIEQYKSLESSADPDDFIGQQTKKFQLKRIKDKLQKLFKEQESSKSQKIAKKTGTPEIPGAAWGDFVSKAGDFFKSDGFKKAGNFVLDNPEMFYNLGQGVFGKDIPQINASQYMTEFNPDMSLLNIDQDAMIAPIKDQVASSQYNILRGGGSASEKIAANMQLSGKAGFQLAAAEAKGQMLQNQLGLNIFERQAEIDQNNKMLALKLNMMNEQRGAARNTFFQEAIGDFGQYTGAKNEENFMKDLYDQRFGTGTGTGSGTGGGTGFNFSLGNMMEPTLNTSSGTWGGLNTGYTYP